VTAVLIDTHVLAWSLIDPDRIGAAALALIEGGGPVYVPPCCLHEIALKVRKGRWDAMAPHVGRLDALCSQQGFQPAPYSLRMAMLAGGMGWAHPDPFDRMIAATAIEMAIPLASTDTAFDGLDGTERWQGRVWEG
jgi:PIN domain nuclease of toxin-antitoxin system